MKLSFIIPKQYAKIAYHQVFSSHFEMSQSLIRRIRLHGQFMVDGKEEKMISLAKGGETCILSLPTPKEAPPKVNVNHLQILFEDEHFIAINKPQDMVTHPSLNHYGDSLLDALGDYTFHPITRLDKDTFGIVLIGKNPYVHQVTSIHPMQKIYLGLCYHRPQLRKGAYNDPIARHSTSLIERVVSPEGQSALTLYQELSYCPTNDISLIKYELKTGRTHQIRVHSAYHHHPLVGDSLYAPEKIGSLWIEKHLSGQALVAYQLSFYHPIHREYIHLQAPLPPVLEIMTKGNPKLS